MCIRNRMRGQFGRQSGQFGQLLARRYFTHYLCSVQTRIQCICFLMMWAKMAEVGENPQTDTESQKQKNLAMNINSLLSADANISVVVSIADLKEFALNVVAEAMAAKEAEKKEEKYLTPDDVADMVGVSKNTLWRWEKEKYLIPIKVGRKSRYKLSDVKSILEGRG